MEGALRYKQLLWNKEALAVKAAKIDYKIGGRKLDYYRST